MYQSPGNADNLSDKLLTKWNDEIKTHGTGSRFFKINPNDIQAPTRARVEWFGDPKEPKVCMGDEIAQQLSDWDIQGRGLHNEYVEYAIIRKPDSTGKLRPKRVQVTTELKDYWICIATYDPTQLRNMVEGILGSQPAWEDLYGVNDPFSLSDEVRKKNFTDVVGGRGQPFGSLPTGKINTENALFMTHGINDLYSLAGLLVDYSKPYNVVIDGTVEKCTLEQLLHHKRAEGLACRHADPIALYKTYSAVFKGRDVAFDNPLGMYIQTFAKNGFTFQDEPIPENWIKFSRGQKGTNGRVDTFQRLDFGPSDEESEFLDDISIDGGPLLGGYQILKEMTVGPLIIAGSETQILENEYKNYRIENPNNQEISCNDPAQCSFIKQIKTKYDEAHSPTVDNGMTIDPR
jgi:hypothetical protein